MAVMDALVDTRPDVVFTVDTVGLMPRQYCFMENIRIISWFFDQPGPFLKRDQFSAINNFYWLYCWDRTYEEVVRCEGIERWHHRPFAGNPTVYRNMELPEIYDVSFVATWSQVREDHIRPLLEAGITVDIWGNDKWIEKVDHPNLIFHGFADNRNDCPRIYNQSKININITNIELKTALPVRIFDVGATGSFLLTDDRLDARECYGEEALPIYSDSDDLIAKIHYYLEHEDERRRCAEKLFEITCSKFTFNAACAELLESCFNDTREFQNSELSPDDLASAAYKNGMSLHKHGKNDEAFKLFLTALNITPLNQVLLTATAALANHNGETDWEKRCRSFLQEQQINILENALEAGPASADYWNLLYHNDRKNLLPGGFVPNAKARLFRHQS